MDCIDRGRWGNLDWLCFLHYELGKNVVTEKSEDLGDLRKQIEFYRELVEKDLGVRD